MIGFLRRFWFYERLKRNPLARAVLLPVYYFLRDRVGPTPKIIVGGTLALMSRGTPDPSLIVMIVVSDVWIDPRVEREARTLAETGYAIKILAPDCQNGRAPDWGENITFRLFNNRIVHALNRFPYVFSAELTLLALEQCPFAFHCHDLNTFVAGYIAAKRSDAKLVIDMHEWFSENVSDQGGRLVPHTGRRKRIYQRAEKFALQNADIAITVCPSIAHELRKIHARQIEVIRNIPPVQESTPYPSLKQFVGIPDDKFVILYQGGVGPTRHLELMIAALSHLSDDVVLVIRGPGIDFYRTHYEQLSTQLGVRERVHLLAPVASADVVSAARGADAGIWSLEPICRNFEYALPNKIFEYLAAGLPVLTADLPEARRNIIEPGLGYGFINTPMSIAMTVERLRQDGEIKKRVANCRIEPEWYRLADLVREAQPAQPVCSMAAHKQQESGN